MQVQYMSLTKHNKETRVHTKFIISYSVLHLIFCDSYRVGDGQKAFFETVVEYSTCKYLGNYLNGKHNRHTTWYLSLK